MARRTFFSFNYKDVWRVNQIRSMTNVIGTSAAGFEDASIWEEAKKKGDAAIKRMIDEALKNTSVTVVFVTYGTASRKYIKYEVDKSLERGNGLIAVQIHHLKDQNGDACGAGACPDDIESNGYKFYKYSDKEALARWIEAAAKKAGK